MFRKFVSASLLNLLGLSLAFASFFVIMTQVNYDLGYNKSFTEHEKLFRLTMKLGSGMEDYGVTLPPVWSVAVPQQPSVQIMRAMSFSETHWLRLMTVRSL